MESEAFNIEDALKALALLSAIPVVLFALWGDYLERRVLAPPAEKSADPLDFEEPLEERPPIDLKLEVEKVRITSLCVILFLFTLLIGSYEIRQAYPIAVQLIFCTSVLAQLWTQFRIEKKINPAGKAQVDPMMGVTFRAALSWIAGAFLYVFCVFASCRFAFFLSSFLKASQNLEILLFSAGCIIGILFGLAVNFALTPLFLKKIFPISEVAEENLKKELSQCFSGGGVKVPQLYIIEISQSPTLHALFAGFQKGKGLFHPAFFISRSTLDKLNPTEIKALVLNQVSHAALKHMRKKIFLSFSLILLTTFLSISAFVFSHHYFPNDPNLSLSGPVVAMICFFASFKLMLNQMDKHQLQADLHSIQQLGVKFNDFALYLRKMETQKGENIIPGVLAHPETENRIKKIENILNQIPKTIEKESIKTAA